MHRGDRRLVVAVHGVAVAEQNHVLDGGFRLAESLVGRVQIRRVTSRVAQTDGLDLAFDGGLVRQWGERNDHPHGAVGDTNHVA